MSDTIRDADDDPEEWGAIPPRVRPEPSGDVARVLAREGSTVYTIVGEDVYYSVGRSLPRWYCALRNWPHSPAAKRQADPRRQMPDMWTSESAGWGWVE